MDCSEARDSFSDYLDGELHAQAKEALEAHLGRCATCRNELEAIRKAVALVESLPKLSAPPAILDRVRFCIAAKAKAKPKARPAILAGWRWVAVAAAAAAVVLAVLLTLPWTGGVSPTPVAIAPNGVPGGRIPGGSGKVNGGDGAAISPDAKDGTPGSHAGQAPGGIAPDNMATRPDGTPDIGPIAPLPEVTPVPDSGKDKVNGGLRIYVGPRAEFRGSNAVRLRPMHELMPGITVQAAPGAEDVGGAENRAETGQDGVRTPTVVLCAGDVREAAELAKTVLRTHGAEFTLSQRGQTVRFVAVLQGVKARKAVEALREMDSAKVVLEAVPQAAYEQTPTTLVIEVTASN